MWPDQGQLYVLGGGAYDFTPWLRAHCTLDTHVLFGEPTRLRGGLSLGLEMGTWLFVSLMGRASPWRDAGGYGSGQLGVGLREF